VFYSRGKSRQQKRYYRKKSIQRQKRKIKNRALAKEQFWALMRMVGHTKGAPKSSWSTPSAKSIAAVNVSVQKGGEMLYPHMDLRSNVEAAEGYRPYAEVEAIKVAEFRLKQMARRIGKKQKRAWKK